MLIIYCTITISTYCKRFYPLNESFGPFQRNPRESTRDNYTIMIFIDRVPAEHT